MLLFWKEAEEYLNMFSQGDRAACAQRIFQRYMKRGAEFEINLSGINDATVAAIEAQLRIVDAARERDRNEGQPRRAASVCPTPTEASTCRRPWDRLQLGAAAPPLFP